MCQFKKKYADYGDLNTEIWDIFLCSSIRVAVSLSPSGHVYRSSLPQALCPCVFLLSISRKPLIAFYMGHLFVRVVLAADNLEGKVNSSLKEEACFPCCMYSIHGTSSSQDLGANANQHE